MSIVRTTKRDNPFVQVDKHFGENSNLSWAAKGLLFYCLSRPDGWTIRKKDLVKRSSDGQSSLETALIDLMLNGYVYYYPDRDEKGRIEEWIYEVYERPELNPRLGESVQKAKELLDSRKKRNKRKVDKRKHPEVEYPEVEYPEVEYPKVDSPKVEVPAHSNNKSSNNKSSNNKSKNKESQSVRLPDNIKSTIEQSGLTDRLPVIEKVYQSVKDQTGYSHALFIQTLQKEAFLKEAKRKGDLALERYLRKAVLNNITESISAVNTYAPSTSVKQDKLPESIIRQLDREKNPEKSKDDGSFKGSFNDWLAMRREQGDMREYDIMDFLRIIGGESEEESLNP